MFLIVGEILKKDLEGGIVIKKFWELMEEKGYIHEISPDSLNGVRTGNEISYIISRGAHFKYTKDVLEKFPNLKKIFLFQIGNDNVDLEYCKQKGIEVVNFVSKKSIYSVAEQTIASLIGGIRQIFTTGCNLKKDVSNIGKDEGKMRKDKTWDRVFGNNLTENTTIGIMGFGRIGQKVAELLSIFPCNIVAYDVLFNEMWKDEGKIRKDKIDEKTYRNLSFSILPKSFLISNTLQKLLKNGKLKITGDLDSFLKDSDYITVHIPGFKENLGLLDYSKLQNVKGVVNMARAGIVVEEDILKLLDEGKMEFYVSDVVEGEPYIDKINEKLIKHPKVFITPHIGANTIQVQEDIMKQFLEYYLRKNV